MAVPWHRMLHVHEQVSGLRGEWTDNMPLTTAKDLAPQHLTKWLNMYMNLEPHPI